MEHLTLFRVLLLLQLSSLAFIGTKADTLNCTIELDLCFVVDTSGSICNDQGGPCSNWYKLLEFIADVVSNMTISDLDIRVAMIEFETSAYLKWNLTTYGNKAALLEAIKNLPYIGGNTNTVAALDLLSTVFTVERGDRPGVRNTAILITDGKPRRGDDPIPVEEIRAAVQRVLNLDIRLMVVGVTDSIDMDMLKELSSPPHTINETVFVVQDYQHLKEVLRQLQIQTCINYTTQTESTPAALCTEALDFCFVIDRSGSICDSDPDFDYNVDETCKNWMFSVNFTRAVVDSFDIGDQAARVGLVIFASTSYVAWNLTAFTDKGALLDAISSIPYLKGGTTDMTGGINLMRTQVFGLSNDRLDVPNTAIFMTDGYPTMPATLEDEIVAMRNSGIRSLVVGITDKIDLSTIRRLASQPPVEDETYFLAADYPSLEEKVASQLSRRACFTPPMSSTLPATVQDITPPTNTPLPACDDAALDLCFLIDESGSICDNDPDFDYNTDDTCRNWRLIIEFVYKLIQGIFSSQVTRIGLVLFSTEAKVAFELTKYTVKEDLLAAVSNLTYVKGGTTDMAGALRLARTQVFNTAGDRQGFPNTEVVITDGRPTDPAALQPEIDATRQSGIRVLALGVTNDVDETTLRRLSSSPQQLNVTYFMALDYVDIESFRKTLQERICQNNP